MACGCSVSNNDNSAQNGGSISKLLNMFNSGGAIAGSTMGGSKRRTSSAKKRPTSAKKSPTSSKKRPASSKKK